MFKINCSLFFYSFKNKNIKGLKSLKVYSLSSTEINLKINIKNPLGGRGRGEK
jgi:hypothetical protein